MSVGSPILLPMPREITYLGGQDSPSRFPRDWPSFNPYRRVEVQVPDFGSNGLVTEFATQYIIRDCNDRMKGSAVNIYLSNRTNITNSCLLLVEMGFLWNRPW